MSSDSRTSRAPQSEGAGFAKISGELENKVAKDSTASLSKAASAPKTVGQSQNRLESSSFGKSRSMVDQNRASSSSSTTRVERKLPDSTDAVLDRNLASVSKSDGSGSRSSKLLAVELGDRTPPSSPVRCLLNSQRCGTLELDFGSEGVVGGGFEYASPKPTPPPSRMNAKRANVEKGSYVRGRIVEEEDDATHQPLHVVAEEIPEPPSPRSVRSFAGTFSTEQSFDERSRRYSIDFELPRDAAPYVDPLETLRRDVRCMLRLRLGKSLAEAGCYFERLREATCGSESSSLRENDDVVARGGDSEEERRCRRELEISGGWATEGSLELARASEAKFSAARESLASFERQVKAFEPRAEGALGSDWVARETNHVLMAAKGALISSWSSYARAAEREHACFADACRAAESALGLFWANASRALSDLDSELKSDLVVYRRKSESAQNSLVGLHKSGDCSSRGISEFGERVVQLLERLDTRACFQIRGTPSSSANGDDPTRQPVVCAEIDLSRLRGAAQEIRRAIPEDKPVTIARALRELRRWFPSDPEVGLLVEEAKPLLRSCAVDRVDAEALRAALKSETLKRTHALLEDCERRLRRLESETAVAFELRLDSSQRAKQEALSADRERLATDRANLASFENRLALHDRGSFYVLAHAKELLQQSVASAWAYDRLRMFRTWLEVRHKVQAQQTQENGNCT